MWCSNWDRSWRLCNHRNRGTMLQNANIILQLHYMTWTRSLSFTAPFSGVLFSETTGWERISLCSFLCWLSRYSCSLSFSTNTWFSGAYRATVVESSDELHWKFAESYLSPADAWFALLRLDHGPYFQHLVWSCACYCNTSTCVRIAWDSDSNRLLATLTIALASDLIWDSRLLASLKAAWTTSGSTPTVTWNCLWSWLWMKVRWSCKTMFWSWQCWD